MPNIASTVKELGYMKPTPIQKMVIPKILAGSDVIAGAQTGTGKTAAFTLPMLQKLASICSEKPGRVPKGLVLAPTRELARQVYENVKEYSKNTNLKSMVMFGGVDYKSQVKKLENGVDIVIATPGRLQDLLDEGHVALHGIKYLVLDEADRMLDMGFAPAVRKIMSSLPRERQTVFFSATFTHEVKNLAKSLLQNPVSVQSEESNSASNKVTQIVHPVDAKKKASLLSFLIGSNNWQQVLIFTRTKVNADKLSKELALDGIKNMAIHGDRTQAHRTKALAHFKEGKIQALVATDIASRGIDIENLPYVINYELPNIPEDYVHRIGRTGRAGQEGLAVTLVTDKEVYRLDQIEKLIKTKLDKKRVAGFEPVNFDPQAAMREARATKRRPYGEPRQMRSDRSLRKRTNKKGASSSSSSSNSDSKPKRYKYKDDRPSSGGGNRKKKFSAKPSKGGAKFSGRKPKATSKKRASRR